MATGTFNNPSLARAATVGANVNLGTAFWYLLRVLGSLKITVAMFAVGTLILFVGTLAQDEETIVDVKKAYFNSWVASVPLDVFVPQTIWPHEQRYPYAFAIPGGALVGLILLVNLIAAKLTRFAMNAKGGRFVAGLVFTVLGFGLVAIVVVGAHLGDGIQGEPPFSYDSIWFGTKATLYALALGSLAWILGWTPKTKVVRWTGIVCTGLLLTLSGVMLLTNDHYRIPDPGLRIVWQLTKSFLVSGVLLTGLILLFGNRGGNVLIHLGVGLLMLGQFIFGDAQREERITLFEGQKTLVAFEPDAIELVFIDDSGAKTNRVVAFDAPMLMQSAERGNFLSSKELPVEFRVDRWMESSGIVDENKSLESDPVFEGIQGLGAKWRIREASKSGGAKSEVNYASAVITLRSKSDEKPVGKYLVSQFINDDAAMFRAVMESVQLDGSDSKEWKFGLRFKRNYKPYSITLDDVVLEQYTGIMKPKDYSSFVKVSEPDGDVLQQGRIWMNNPMRYRGETFYQSGYMSANDSPTGVEQTTLQVVTNAGWLIPYVACVLSGLGMLVHFSSTFARFAARYERNAIAVAEVHKHSGPLSHPHRMEKGSTPDGSRHAAATGKQPPAWIRIGVPLLVCGVFGLWIAKSAYIGKPKENQIDWYAIGQLPTQYGGRIKPLASASAEFLEILSNKKYALSKEGHVYEPQHKTGKAIDSVQWIMAVFAREDWVFDSPLIRVDAQEITSALGLKRHKSNRYSFNEISEGLKQMKEPIEKLFSTGRKSWTFEQQKLAEVLEKVMALRVLADAYEPLAPRISDDPASMMRQIGMLQQQVDSIRDRSPIAVIPPVTASIAKPGEKSPPEKWDAFGPALFETIKSKVQGKDTKSESVLSFMALVDASSKQTKDASDINAKTAEFRANVEKDFATSFKATKVRYEAWYEHFDPISVATWTYLFCGLLALVSVPAGGGFLRQTSFWLCVMALLVHTIAIGSRIYISERPPVVTLYSAAVFIGWAMVLFCIVAEFLFPISISLIVAAIAGYLTLSVAYGLDVGDSMPVLEAVLDTQFWLSTHVISVSLGYSATFVAGLIGIGIIVAASVIRFASPKSNAFAEATEKLPVLYRICYGVVCFGIFFSFVGTVLGGLWGDDSWGRFWGWDPKENGALMIVLWNALLLHARWDKMVGALGFGILAVFGNIITAWSMFGTNLLGVGLHSYGFNSTTLSYLAWFAASQLVCIAFGCLIVFLGGIKNPQSRSSLREEGV